MMHFSGASTFLLFLPFKNSTACSAQNPSGKNVDFRDDLDLVTVACLRTHPLDFLPHRSSDKRASAALHDEMINRVYTTTPSIPSFQDDPLPNANYTKTVISTTVLSVHFMLRLRLVPHRKTIHAMPSKAIGNKGIDASVFVESEVGPIATE
jgi:hypothetical protein